MGLPKTKYVCNLGVGGPLVAATAAEGRAKQGRSLCGIAGRRLSKLQLQMARR